MPASKPDFDSEGVWAVLEGRRDVLDPAVEHLLVALGQSNAAQWDAEDRSRATRVPTKVAAEKAVIDDLNARRVQLVLELDRLLHATLAPAAEAPPLTETPGSICDRLSVLHLRLVHSASAVDRPRAEEVLRRVPGLLQQAGELRWAFDVMLADVRAGRRSFNVHEPNKLYGAGPGGDVADH